jgi:outer membrane protein
MDDYEFVDPNPEKLSSESELSDVNKLIQNAMSDRKDYQAQQFTLSSLNSGVASAFGGYLPRLSLGASFGTSATEPSLLFKNRNYGANLNLSWSLFSGWSTEQSYQSAQISLLNAQEDTRALERQIKIDVKQGISDYQAAIKAYDVALKNLKSAEEAKRINVEKYTLGSGTILEVLSSDASYLQAVQNKISQQFQLYRTKDRLMVALGVLDYKKYESK